jgi:hypothetical protein
MDPEKMAKSFGMKFLVTQQKIALSEMQQAAEKNNMTAYNKAKEYYDKMTALLKKYTEMSKLAHGELTDEQIKELKKAHDAEVKKTDDLRKYEFDSGRISFFDYIQYLKSREDSVKSHYGELSAEYLKYKDNILSMENDLLNQQSDNQGRLTADFSDLIRKRLGEVQKFVNKSTSTAVTETGKESKAITGLMSNMGSALSMSVISQLERGASATKNLGDALVKMVESFAATLAAKTIIWFFFDLVTSGGVGKLTDFLGFNKGVEVTGKASGGVIDRSDIARSAFTPSGEDGLIGVQIGETIVNRRATQMFAPVLEKLNEMGRRSYGYAGGGTVPDHGMLVPGSFEGIIEAIQNIKIEIKAELDSISFLRENYPKYQRITDKNRI